MRGAVACRAPAHHPQPRRRGGDRREQRQPRELRFEAGRELGHVGRHFGRHAGLHRDVDEPHAEREQREEEHREPVDRRTGAAAQSRQREGGQHGHAGQAEQQRTVGAAHGQAGHQAADQHGQRDGQVPPRQVIAPSPQRPQRQQPRRPEEPQPLSRHVQQLAHRQRWRDTPGPLIEQRCGHAGEMRWPPPPTSRSAACRRRANARRPRRRRCPARRRSWVRRCTPAPAMPARCPRARASGEMPPPRATTAPWPPQPAGPARASFRGRAAAGPASRSAPGSSRRRSRAHSPPPAASPPNANGSGCAASVRASAKLPYHRATSVRREQQRERDAHRQRRIEPRRGQRDEGGADPVRQVCRIGRHAAERRRQPGRAALGHRQHLAERREVGVLPGIAPEHTGQHVGRAQQQQRKPRQRARGIARDQGRNRGAHGSIMPQRLAAGALGAAGKQKGSRSCLDARASEAHFLRPTRANLLRNFSTRPPRLSTLFCVPV